MARPPKPIPQDKADEIIEWISSGKTLRDYCRQEGNPHWNTVYDWLDKDEEFSVRFARARERGFDAIAQEALDIVDTFPLSSGDDGKLDSAHVSWLKNRFESRLKLLSKWDPKRYGDKLDLTSKGQQVGLAITIDMGEEK